MHRRGGMIGLGLSIVGQASRRRPISILPPITNFTADDTTPTTGQLITLAITNTGGVATSGLVTWGDGDDDALVAPFTSATHTYSLDGLFTVAVDLTNAAGTSQKLREDYLTVSPASSPFSLTIPIAGTFEVAVNGNATELTAEAYGFGDGVTKGDYCKSINKSLTSGDVCVANNTADYTYFSNITTAVTLAFAVNSASSGSGNNVGDTITLNGGNLNTGKLIVSGKTAGTGLICGKLIIASDEDAGFARFYTLGAHGRNVSDEGPISDTPVAAYNQFGVAVTAKTATTFTTDLVFDTAFSGVSGSDITIKGQWAVGA